MVNVKALTSVLYDDKYWLPRDGFFEMKKEVAEIYASHGSVSILVETNTLPTIADIIESTTNVDTVDAFAESLDVNRDIAEHLLDADLDSVDKIRECSARYLESLRGISRATAKHLKGV